MSQATAASDATSDALIEHVVASTIGLFDLAGLYLGQRLGFYRALRDGGPATSRELAERTGTDQRYAREWLEHQAVTGVLAVDDANADADKASTHSRAVTPTRWSTPTVPATSSHSLARRSGCCALCHSSWRPSGRVRGSRITSTETTRGGDCGAQPRDVHQRARDELVPRDQRRPCAAGVPPGACVADLGCGMGWSSIAIARAYPHAFVDGFDADTASIEAAAANAAAEGLENRVRFFVRDASDARLEGMYDVVTIFEALHDMARPVEALATARRLLAEGGTAIVADERVAERFGAPGEDLERLMYGFSVVHCLAVGRADHERSAATGTVMRPTTLQAYADAAGFSRVETLPTDNDFWRFYRLDR